MTNHSKITRVAAVGDLHTLESDKGKWELFFNLISQKADILLLCGDLTDTGQAIEAQVLSEELRSCSIPVVAVLGNHDYDRDLQHAIKNILAKGNVTVLNGDFVVINNVGIAGIKGFGGGFNNALLPMFGEKILKEFVNETVHEVL